MKCRDVMELLRKIAPEQYALEWDNVGLLVGREEKEIKRVLVALDATDSVIEQAVEGEADLLVTHHPMLFAPLKRIVDSDMNGRRILRLIGDDICYYAMHTNCDTMVMAEEAADRIGLREGKVLEPAAGETEIGIGRYGELEEEITLWELCDRVKKAFGLESVRLVGDPGASVKRAAISTGSGKSMIRPALCAGVQVLVTGDIDHHSALDSLDQGLSLIDAGHYGTERFMVDLVADYLTQFGLDVWKAEESSPFQEI